MSHCREKFQWCFCRFTESHQVVTFATKTIFSRKRRQHGFMSQTVSHYRILGRPVPGPTTLPAGTILLRPAEQTRSGEGGLQISHRRLKLKIGRLIECKLEHKWSFQVWTICIFYLYNMVMTTAKSTVRKKTYNLDGELIEKVRILLGARTDTEAIQKALAKTAENREIEASLDRLLREGRFRTVYR